MRKPESPGIGLSTLSGRLRSSIDWREISILNRANTAAGRSLFRRCWKGLASTSARFSRRRKIFPSERCRPPRRDVWAFAIGTLWLASYLLRPGGRSGSGNCFVCPVSSTQPGTASMINPAKRKRQCLDMAMLRFDKSSAMNGDNLTDHHRKPHAHHFIGRIAQTPASGGLYPENDKVGLETSPDPRADRVPRATTDQFDNAGRRPHRSPQAIPSAAANRVLPHDPVRPLPACRDPSRFLYSGRWNS